MNTFDGENCPVSTDMAGVLEQVSHDVVTTGNAQRNEEGSIVNSSGTEMEHEGMVNSSGTEIEDEESEYNPLCDTDNEEENQLNNEDDIDTRRPFIDSNRTVDVDFDSKLRHDAMNIENDADEDTEEEEKSDRDEDNEEDIVNEKDDEGTENDEETEDEKSVASYSEYYEPKDCNALSCEERKKIYEELEARVKFLDEDIEDSDKDLKRNERFALCAGLYKQNTRNPFCHKTLIGSSKYITEEIEKATAAWKPSMAFKLLIFRECKLERGSLFDQACDYICCLSAEMKCTEWRIIDLKGFSLHLPTSRRGYRVSYTKCCRTGRTGKKYHAQRTNPLQANVMNTMVKILAALKQTYTTKTHTLDVKRKEPIWTSPKTLQNHFENLMQIFHVSLLVTEFIFRFLERGKAESLVPFCAEMLKDITHNTTLWDVMEQLCRVFSQSEKNLQQQDIMNKIAKNPSEVQSYLQQAEANVFPEHYRDKLLMDMNKEFKYKRDLLWKGKIEVRDMLIVRFYVLNKVYHQPDKTRLLIRKQGTTAVKLKEKHRHDSLQAQYACDLSETETTVEKQQGKESKNGEKISNEDDISVASLQDNNLNLLQSKRNDLSDKIRDDGNATVASDPIAHSACDDGTVGCDDESDESDEHNDVENDKECEDEDKAYGDNHERCEEEDDDGPILVGKKHIQFENCPKDSSPRKKRTCMKPPSQIFTLHKGVTNDDLQKEPMLLKIVLAEKVSLFIVYSAVQLLWTTCLHISRHKVTPIKEEILNLQFRAKTGYTWLPEGVSHRTKEYGVLRSGHADFITYFGHTLQKLNCQLLCDFLTSNGKKDSARDGEHTKSYRIDMGLTNHNYDWRQESRTPFTSFRDRPKIVNIGLMKRFDPALPSNVALLLDSMQLALDDQYKKLNMEPPLQNAFIDELFCKPLRAELGCKHFRFPSFTIGLTQLTEEDDPDANNRNKEAQKPVVIAHEDNLNGQEDGNDMSLIFHVCIKAEARNTENCRHVLLRIYVIAYTRRSAEHYAKNEELLSELKEQLRMFRDSVNLDYKRLANVMPAFSFNHPEHLFLNDEIVHEDLDIGSDRHPAIQKVLRLRVSYAPEISVSAGATIIRRILRTRGRNKALEAMVLASYMCFWGRFYFAGLEMLETCPIESDENIALYMVKIMETKFGHWSGGKTTRGHASSLNFQQHYSNQLTMEKARDAIDKFLRKVDDSSKMELKDYQILVKDMIVDLDGVGEFYGQRILLPATLAGLVTHHVKHATLGYPIQNSGSSYRTIEQLQANQEARANNPTLYSALNTIRLSPHVLHFKRTARLSCNFCGIDERPIWGEHIYCEGMVSNHLGRNNTSPVYDYLFRGQSLFWIFKDHYGMYSVKEKKYGEVQWCTLDDLSPRSTQQQN